MPENLADILKANPDLAALVAGHTSGPYMLRCYKPTCHHTWIQRSPAPPGKCPHCQSRHWFDPTYWLNREANARKEQEWKTKTPESKPSPDSPTPQPTPDAPLTLSTPQPNGCDPTKEQTDD